MRIYLAGSFNEMYHCRKLAVQLRVAGHEVFCFCDEDTQTYKLSMRVRNGTEAKDFTPQTALKNIDVYNIGYADWREIDKSDLVIIALPCGKSAHLEGGYAKGKGKKVCVFGPMIKGEWDCMYVMADRVFDIPEFEPMVDWIATLG